MTGNIQAPAKTEEATISAVVVRADGRREDLGVISYYHKHRHRRAWWHVKKALKSAWQKVRRHG